MEETTGRARGRHIAVRASQQMHKFAGVTDVDKHQGPEKRPCRPASSSKARVLTAHHATLSCQRVLGATI